MTPHKSRQLRLSTTTMQNGASTLCSNWKRKGSPASDLAHARQYFAIVPERSGEIGRTNKSSMKDDVRTLAKLAPRRARGGKSRAYVGPNRAAGLQAFPHRTILPR